NDRRRELADRRLMTADGLEVRRDVRVDRERDVEEDDALHALERLLGFLRREVGEEALVDELQVAAIRAEGPLRREPDALVHPADTQPILDVREVAPAAEEPHEVLALRVLHAAHGRFVREEALRLGVLEEQRVERLDDVLGVLLGERLERREAREIFVAE